MRLRFWRSGILSASPTLPTPPDVKKSGTSLLFVSVPFTNSSKRVIILRDG
mgnify:CR=1 FL=1